MSEVERPLCAKCGVQPRRRHDYLCHACREAPRLANLAYLDAVWRETQAYRRPPPPAPPPTSPGKPEGPCPRCGGAWMDRSNAVWSCRSCGFDPALPDGPRWQAALYEVPEPVPPLPPPWVCGVCGPTDVWTREDGSQQCALCGAVRG
jgi:hypothetical protein